MLYKSVKLMIQQVTCRHQLDYQCNLQKELLAASKKQKYYI